MKTNDYIHFFPADESTTPLPELFTYPFQYVPHPLCIKASQAVQHYLQGRADWHEELQQGKMFGVLVVRHPEGKIGFLAAFSGNLAGSNHHPFFVPPVYDLLHPEGYFKQEEERISLLNQQLEQLENDARYLQLLRHRQEQQQLSIEDLQRLQQQLKMSKQERDRLRQQGNLTETERLELENRSRTEKRLLKNRKQEWAERLEALQRPILAHEQQLQALQEERKQRSFALQQWIFRQFRLQNAHHEVKDLCELFADTPQGIPPAGTGECAAPKLLQYAYLHRLHPLAMAEFWWGDSPKGEIRRHGHFYPSCKHKCEPILRFMLQGLDVEPNPLLTPTATPATLEIVYEDQSLVVVNKPAGLLSVPGKSDQPDVLSILQQQYPEATGPLLVHRLDMDTSGLLVAAKDKDTHALLQQQFEGRTVKKRYLALLDGTACPPAPKGFIRLPLRPDYDNRPYQIVDPLQGKPAVTRYELGTPSLLTIDGQERPVTSVAYYPETGRTHQLRVHSAHPDGMNYPILGDPLYGQPADRMYLHAESLEFRHPVNGKRMRFSCPPPFPTHF